MGTVYDEILEPVVFPKMYKFRQKFADDKINDIEAHIIKEITSFPNIDLVKGHTVALAVGSRGIRNIAMIVKTVVETLRKHGATVFIVPALLTCPALPAGCCPPWRPH